MGVLLFEIALVPDKKIPPHTRDEKEDDEQ
jgi:hypothetical protein